MIERPVGEAMNDDIRAKLAWAQQQRDYPTEWRLLRLLEGENDPAVYFRIAQLYMVGIAEREPLELAQSKRMAAPYLEKAADLGHPAAKYRLGIYYKRGEWIPGDKAKAYQLFCAGAELGDPFAVAEKGEALLFGEGTEQDVAAGLALLREGAAAGAPNAQLQLAKLGLTAGSAAELVSGVEAEDGLRWIEVLLNQRLNEKWLAADMERWMREQVPNLERLARSGNSRAAFVLAQLCYTGRFTAQDSELADMWMKRAADGGHVLAKIYRGASDVALRNDSRAKRDLEVLLDTLDD